MANDFSQATLQNSISKTNFDAHVLIGLIEHNNRKNLLRKLHIGVNTMLTRIIYHDILLAPMSMDVTTRATSPKSSTKTPLSARKYRTLTKKETIFYEEASKDSIQSSNIENHHLKRVDLTKSKR